MQEIKYVVDHRLPNGDIYTGAMIKGAPNGKGVLNSYVDSRERTRDGDFIGDGSIYVTHFKGDFECGHIEGHGVEIKSDGTVLEGNFQAGKKLGNFLTTDSSGVVFKQLYHFDLLTESTPANLSHMENVPNNQDANITHVAAIKLIKQENQYFQR